LSSDGRCPRSGSTYKGSRGVRDARAGSLGVRKSTEVFPTGRAWPEITLGQWSLVISSRPAAESSGLALVSRYNSGLTSVSPHGRALAPVMDESLDEPSRTFPSASPRLEQSSMLRPSPRWARSGKKLTSLSEYTLSGSREFEGTPSAAGTSPKPLFSKAIARPQPA
jgi:hypothetical protein